MRTRDKVAGCTCGSEDPNVVFAESPADLEQAKDIWRRCAARHSCLADALDRIPRIDHRWSR